MTALSPEHIAKAAARFLPGQPDAVKDLLAVAEQEQIKQAHSEVMSKFQPFDIAVVESGLTVSFGSESRVLLRGEVITVTPEIYKASLDHAGHSWLDLSDAEQVRAFGEIKFRKGPWRDEYGPRMERDSIRWERARRQAFREARALPDHDARSAALHKVTTMWGAEPSYATYDDSRQVTP
jgi:hypothetical protein